MKGGVSLFSSSVCLPYVCSKDTDFFELILYPATLLKGLINSRSFLGEYFWFTYVYNHILFK